MVLTHVVVHVAGILLATVGHSTHQLHDNGGGAHSYPCSSTTSGVWAELALSCLGDSTTVEQLRHRRALNWARHSLRPLMYKVSSNTDCRRVLSCEQSTPSAKADAGYVMGALALSALKMDAKAEAWLTGVAVCTEAIGVFPRNGYILLCRTIPGATMY